MRPGQLGTSSHNVSGMVGQETLNARSTHVQVHTLGICPKSELKETRCCIHSMHDAWICRRPEGILWVPTKWKIIHAESIYFDENTSFQDHADDSLPLVDLFTNKEPTIPEQETSQVNTSPNSAQTGDVDTAVPDSPPGPQVHPQHTWREPAQKKLNSSEEAYWKAAELPPFHQPKDNEGSNTHYANMAEHLMKEDHAHFAYSAVTLNTDAEPKSYKEAMCSTHAEEWQDAIDERNSLIALGVFETVRHSDVPNDHKIVRSKMVFKIKSNEKGETTHYKVCIVAKGYSQVPGVDFFDTYAPATHLTSVTAGDGLCHMSHPSWMCDRF